MEWVIFLAPYHLFTGLPLQSWCYLFPPICFRNVCIVIRSLNFPLLRLWHLYTSALRPHPRLVCVYFACHAVVPFWPLHVQSCMMGLSFCTLYRKLHFTFTIRLMCISLYLSYHQNLAFSHNVTLLLSLLLFWIYYLINTWRFYLFMI